MEFRTELGIYLSGGCSNDCNTMEVIEPGLVKYNMNRKEVEISEPQCLRHYDTGYADGVRNERQVWINIEEQAPEMKRQVMYFHDMTGGAHIGYYFGIDEEYPGENNHVFASSMGWLTGDATHWMYVPADPFEDEGLAERRAEWIEDAYHDIDVMLKEGKQEIGLDDEFFSRDDDAREI
jgi:hypothetical protein